MEVGRVLWVLVVEFAPNEWLLSTSLFHQTSTGLLLNQFLKNFSLIIIIIIIGAAIVAAEHRVSSSSSSSLLLLLMMRTIANSPLPPFVWPNSQLKKERRNPLFERRRRIVRMDWRKEEEEEFERKVEKSEEDERKLLVARLNDNMGTRKEKKEKKQQKGAESQLEAKRRKESEEKEEEERAALLQAEAHKPDRKVVIDIGVKKVSCTVSVLRNEHNSILYHIANRREEGQELSCMMDEAVWSIVFRWLLL